MVNNYFGTTNRILGATYLDSRAVLHVQEGYQGVNSDGTGNSTEYVDIGDFEISDFSHGGAFRQSLQLNAHALSKRPSYMNSFFSKNLESADSYYDGFDDQNIFDQNWGVGSNQVGTFGLTNSTLQGLSCTYGAFILNTNEFGNYRVIGKFKATNGASETQMSIFTHTDSADLNSFYLFGYYNVGSGGIKFYKKSTGAGSSLLVNIPYVAVDNQDYWFMLSEFQGNVRGYYSTNGYNYTLGVSWDLSEEIDSGWEGGFAGIYIGSGGRPTINVDSFDVQELGTIYTKEDIIKDAYAMAGVNGVTFAAKISGINYFNVLGSGSSVVYGTSNNLYLTGNSRAEDWNIITTSGSTFNNFVAEVGVRGTSNAIFALITGSGSTFYGLNSNWYGNILRSNVDPLNNYTNYIGHYLGGSMHYYFFRGAFWNFKSDNWYRLKLIKSGTNLIWEINDQVVNSIWGISLTGGGTQVALGLLTYRNLGVGVTTEFKNFRISELDDIVEEVTLEPGSQVQSLIDRIMPNGYAVNNKSGNIEIFKIGDSRGVHDINTTDYIDSDMQSLSNIIGKKYEISKSEDSVNVAFNNNARVIRQADSNIIEVITDDLTPTLREAELQLIYDNKDINPVQVGIANRPTLEQYDTINVVDTNLGISKQFIAFNIDKSFSAQDGKFRETLQLNSIEP